MVEMSKIAIGVLISVEIGYFIRGFIYSVGSRIFRSRIKPLTLSKTYGKFYLIK